MSCATRPVLAGQSGFVLAQPTRGVGHWSWVNGSTMMGRGQMGPSLSELRAGQSGPCAYPLSEAAAGFAPQPRRKRAVLGSQPQRRRCGWVRVRHESNQPINQQGNKSINQSINQSIKHMWRKDNAALREATATTFCKWPGPVPLGPNGPQRPGVQKTWGRLSGPSVARPLVRLAAPRGFSGRRRLTTPRHGASPHQHSRHNHHSRPLGPTAATPVSSTSRG